MGFFDLFKKRNPQGAYEKQWTKLKKKLVTLQDGELYLDPSLVKYWITRSNEKLKITDMKTAHLANAMWKFKYHMNNYEDLKDIAVAKGVFKALEIEKEKRKPV